MDIKFYKLGFDNMKQTADFGWEFSKILLIALVFTANMLNQWGNNSNLVLDHT